MCLMCFLQDKFQYKIRTSAQIRSDRFEHTLCKYRDSFIREFKIEINSRLCESHTDENNIKIQNILKKIDIKKIQYFFDKLEDIYISWINADVSFAIKEFEDLLTGYHLLKQNTNIDNLILFRGRNSKEVLSHWDMFHIPFNKRFNIGNQRYSIVGQPLLYLGTSPYCVYKELGESKELRISSFRFKRIYKLKMFNNVNMFCDYIKDKDDHSILTLTSNMIDDNINKLTTNKMKTVFYTMILASCCNFQRRSELKNTSFCEEYVLPQILAQILKNNGYCGVIYTSTKVYTDEILCNYDALSNLIYKNICIFTNYNKDKIEDVTYVYDKDLYTKFILSAPINYNISIDSDYYDRKKSLEDIMKLTSLNKLNEIDNNIVFYINKIIIAYNDIRREMSNDNELEKSVNLHCLLLRNIILNIKDKVKED